MKRQTLKWDNISDTRYSCVHWDPVLPLPNGNVHLQVEPFQVRGADLVRTAVDRSFSTCLTYSHPPELCCAPEGRKTI